MFGCRPVFPLLAVLCAPLFSQTQTSTPSTPIAPRYAAFCNGAFAENVRWLDNRGELINAHDGGILYQDGIYFWYGMALRPLGLGKQGANGAATTTGIRLYSSRDLYNWTDEGVILPCSDDPTSPLHGPMRFERPKMLFNAKTRKYVLWFHYVKFPGDHGDAVGYGDAGVASADSIRGPFTFHGFHRPIDPQGAVKDCTLFQDDDGAAYFIYDRKLPGERGLHIVRLTEDFLGSSEVWAKIAPGTRREAPAMLKHNGYYFLVTSGVSGWTANAARCCRARNILGPYEDLGDPCEGPEAATTYNAQPTYVLPVAGRPGTFILILERHNTTDFTRCSFIWLPVEFPTADTLKVRYREVWRY